MRMYLLLVLGFALTCLSCQEQQPRFEISATISGLTEHAKVVLSETESQKILDSSRVENGQFYFSGTLVETPVELSMVVLPAETNQQALYTSVFIGNEKITISGTKEDFPNELHIDGSEYQKVKSQLHQATAYYDSEFDKNIEKMMDIRNAGNWNDSLQRLYWGENGIFDSIDDQLLTVKKAFVEENVNTHFGLRQLYRMRDDLSREYLASQLDKVNTDLRKTTYAKSIATFLNTVAPREGTQFYNFTAENEAGDKVDFANFFKDEKYVLLEFYAPHCGWCKMALPEIKELAQNEKDRLKVVTFNVDNNKEDWLRTNQLNNISWESLWDEKGRYSDTYIRYRIQGTPTYYLFDPTGKIVGN